MGHTVTASAISDPPTFSWQSGPIPLITTPDSQTSTEDQDQFTHAATEMALVHNCVIRALNCIYIQSPHVPASEHTNFLSFSLATHTGLTLHHDGEESIFFPELQKLTGETTLMQDNIAGHRAFEAPFAAWGAWLNTCLAGTTRFSAARNTALMDAFIPPLTAHLHDEIPTLLALRRFGAALDLQAMFAREAKTVMGGMRKRTVLPVFLSNHDRAFEGGMHVFPPLPAPVVWVLGSVCGRVKAEWWKFGACGFDGVAREVRFRGE
ncbi:hypothetical protein C7974DRAFT_299676 [Boeremia exigua]|uniref:uncharacterized protein n=1 Tax=Boeremia exigua TaxID=749465 RepID=UPI001E8E8127|nr:uncharacterized protein C7974DRAFT_299676 [Boeremia exigua]KAH6644840.1 hypothetical protein C7974DRAFT_299676 [Boeremia exigua]